MRLVRATHLSENRDIGILDYIAKNISSTIPKRPDIDALYSVWHSKCRPSTAAMEKAAIRDGMTLEAKRNQLFERYVAGKLLSGFC